MQDNARSTNYLFVIGDERKLTFNVQASNVCDVTAGMAPFPGRGGMKDMYIPSNKVEYEPLIVQLLLSYDLSEWVYMYKWMIKMKNNAESGNWEEYTRSCELIAMDSQNQPSTSFVYTDCFPFMLEAIQYSVQGESVVLTTTATLRYNRFKVKFNGETIGDDWDGEF